MTIHLNGEPYTLDGPVSVTTLLTRLGIDARRVAVERNVDVVKRQAYDTTIVAEGDEIEIVNFVGGGSAGPASANSGTRSHVQ
ncbi:MAG: sulfur carrier protein ThiS [Vicinamibacterales bacterium]